MNRGDIWLASGGPDYAGRPTPVAILQGDAFDTTRSITICPFTTDATDAPLFRVVVEPSADNGLRAASRLMTDKITTVSRAKLSERIGRLADADIRRLNHAVIVFLGLA